MSGLGSSDRLFGDRDQELTTRRLRYLVDGIEEAVAARDDLRLAELVAPPALGSLLREADRLRQMQLRWSPARTGLSWARSSRRGGRNRVWLTVRLEDRTRLLSEGPPRLAVAAEAELDLELDVSRPSWRLCRAEIVPKPPV